MNLKTIIKYGILWGLLEISLGYVLHLLNSSIAGAVLVPIGVLLMWGVYKSVKRWVSIPIIALIAALVRFVAFLFLHQGQCNNDAFLPSVAILLEGLFFIYPVLFLEKEKSKGSIIFILKPIFVFYLFVVLYTVSFKSIAITIRWEELNMFLVEADIKRELIGVFLDTLISSALIGIAISLHEIYLTIVPRKSS